MFRWVLMITLLVPLLACQQTSNSGRTPNTIPTASAPTLTSVPTVTLAATPTKIPDIQATISASVKSTVEAKRPEPTNTFVLAPTLESIPAFPSVIITENDHVRGNPNAPVTIVEFSDFQCPYCTRFHGTLLQAIEAYPDEVRWVYKHYVIFPPESQQAALAAECVAEQAGNEGFWQFADWIFEDRSHVKPSSYAEFAKEHQLNVSSLLVCVSEERYAKKVKLDKQLGVELGVRGTPGGFINGAAYIGGIPYEELEDLILENLLP